MSLLKRIPIHYKGELHDVRLINFSVDISEVATKVPGNIKVKEFNGRAMISMVDVKLKNMRAVAFPWIKFDYRHVAFRLLVDDSQIHNGVCKGIYFFRSFTDKPLIIAGGTLFTDYNLEMARIEERGDDVVITEGTQYVKYVVNGLSPVPNDALTSRISSLDRAYSMLRNTLRVTQIQREKWPIQLVHCSGFETTFFKTARFEGAYRVFETIYYDWLPPKSVVL